MKRKHLIFLFLGLISVGLFASGIDYNRRVNDLGGILSSSEEQSLSSYLTQIEEQTSAQVALLIIKSLEGENLEDYSLRILENWGKKKGLGQKDRDNGVLLLVALRDRKIRIEVGYGLEPILPDGKCGYIIRNLIAPAFKRGDYYGGLRAAVAKIGGVITREDDISEAELKKYRKQQKKKKGSGFPFGIIVFIIIIALNLMKGGGRGGRGGGIYWGGGGSSGGGFGGFSGGGGSFGGGGASGGW